MIYGFLTAFLFLAIVGLGIFLWVKGTSEKYETRGDEPKRGKKKVVAGIISVIFGACLFFTIPFSFHQVESGEVAVIKKMGQVSHVREAGTHFDFWLTNSRTKYDTKIRSLQIETQAYSQDAQTMTIQMSVHYQILADKATDITIKYGSLDVLESRITGKAIQETKDVLTKRGAEKIIEERNLISQEVADAVEMAIGADYFVDIQTVALTNIDFSDAFEKAVEEKMVAAQKKLQAEIENEMKIQAAEAEAKAKLEAAKQQVEVAEQEALAKKIVAENEAEIIEIQAQAEAEAKAIIAAAWAAMSAEAREATLKQLAIDKWNGELPETLVGDDFLNELLGALTANNP
jgi:regulator of protease activity HflC (stomatin/prohibitin superfamily)